MSETNPVHHGMNHDTSLTLTPLCAEPGWGEG